MSSKYDLPEVPTQVFVTPDMAQDWLKNRTEAFNRPLNRQRIKDYRQTMEEGRWLINHQGFAFNHDGQLRDGQHRLHAIAEADVDGVWVLVSPNVPDEAFSVMDTGFKRQAAHVISGPYKGTVAAAAKILYQLSRNPQNGSSLVGSAVSNDLIVNVVDEWQEELSRYAKAITEVKRYTGINPSVHLAVLAQASRTPHAHLIKEWLESLMTGAGLEKNDPRLQLRNRFMKDRSTLNGSNSGRVEAYSITVKAWNGFVMNKRVQYIRSTGVSAPPPKVVGYTA